VLREKESARKMIESQPPRDPEKIQKKRKSMLRDQKARLKTSKDRKIPMIKTMKHMYSMSHKTSVETISRVPTNLL
jgi:hypothetical protein